MSLPKGSLALQGLTGPLEHRLKHALERPHAADECAYLARFRVALLRRIGSVAIRAKQRQQKLFAAREHQLGAKLSATVHELGVDGHLENAPNGGGVLLHGLDGFCNGMQVGDGVEAPPPPSPCPGNR